MQLMHSPQYQMVSLQQFFDFIIVLALDDVHYLSWIISIEFRRRTYGRTCTAIYAGIQAFLQAIILHQEVVQSSHSSNRSSVFVKDSAF